MPDEGRRREAVVVDTSRSPHARLRPVPVGAVRLVDAFWAPRLRANREVTIPAQHAQCEETGRIDNFRRAAGAKDGSFQGIYFNDSDIYKWLEAASWALASGRDPDLERTVDDVVSCVEAAQQEDGYLDTFFMFEREGERWANLKDRHELYCAGHLIQAAVAHRRATGSDRLLGVATRLADLICRTFGPEETGRRPGAAGHAEIEMALVELHRATGEASYLEAARHLIDARGRKLIGGDEYHQDHRPFREFDRMVGHAVRAVYLNSGAADVVAETGDEGYREALDRMWVNLATKQLYVTGGAGSRHDGEAFGRDYELPNERAYTETCAAIGLVMWAWRMLALDGPRVGDARYADVMEAALVNGVLPGLSLDGARYFYENPLADDGTRRRQEWFGCACCPPNAARMLASLPGYFYSTSASAAWVHLYAEGKANLDLPGGRRLSLAQRTRYPWDGEVEIEVTAVGETDAELALMLRIPCWCAGPASVEVNGRALGVEAYPGSYAEVRREWKAGDTLRLTLPMRARRIECHPHVAENLGRVALVRGPVVYCAEAVDNPGVDLRDLVLPTDASISEQRRDDLLGGVTVLKAPARVVEPGAEWAGRLYRAVGEKREKPKARETELTAVPYYAWANREPGRMQVWIRSG